MIKAIVVSTSLILSTSIANAACVQNVVIPGEIDCQGNDSRSADFAQSCVANPPITIAVPVECPPQETASSKGGRGDGGSGDKGGRYVDTDNDGKTDTFKEGAGKGTNNSGMSTKDSKMTSSGKSGSDTKSGSKSGSKK